jgi:hypothetical protein
MMRSIKIFLILTFGIVQTANATVDYLAANHLTKKLYVYNEEDYQGILWEPIAGEEKTWIEREEFYLNMGYKFTSNPYLLDYILAGVILSTVGWMIIKLKKNYGRRAIKAGEPEKDGSTSERLLKQCRTK